MNRIALCLVLLGAGCGEDPLAPAAPYYNLSRDMGPDQAPPPPDLSRVRTDADPNDDLALVDNTGPSIVFTGPAAGAFVAGIIDVDLDITDPSEVNDDTVKVTLGASNGNPGVEVAVTRQVNTNHYHGIVDTRSLGRNFVLPLLTATASDKAVPRPNSNEISQTLIIDNVNPAIDLDPPDNHHVIKLQAMKYYCSRPFDPVGSWSVNDGEIIQQLSVIRARVEDRGNVAPGQTLEYVSAIRPGSVKLYVSPVSYGPLVIDGNGDAEKICDDVNPMLVPVHGGNNMGKATEVVLSSLMPTGAANFLPDQTPDPVCRAFGLGVGDPNVQMPPPLVCFNDLTIHLWYTDSSKGMMEPSIWSIPPLGAAPAQTCEGLQFDAANSQIPEGPLCAAVVAWDRAGNRNVSKPLRLCYDKGGGLCKDYVQHGGFPDLQKLPDCGMAACTPGVERNVALDGKTKREDPFVSRVTTILQ